MRAPALICVECFLNQAPGIGAPSGGASMSGARQNVSIVLHWTMLSIILTALGLVIHFAGFPMNKQLWSPSYLFFMVCFMVLNSFGSFWVCNGWVANELDSSLSPLWQAGTCGAALVVFYVLADWLHAKWTKWTAIPFRPLQVRYCSWVGCFASFWWWWLSSLQP